MSKTRALSSYFTLLPEHPRLLVPCMGVIKVILSYFASISYTSKCCCLQAVSIKNIFSIFFLYHQKFHYYYSFVIITIRYPLQQIIG